MPFNVEFRRLQANARPAICSHLDAMTAEGRFTRFAFKPAYVNPDNISADVQAFGSARGRIIPAEVLTATARSYEADAVLIEDAGHAVISSSKWHEVTDHVQRRLAN
jgi:hypothetical protein